LEDVDRELRVSRHSDILALSDLRQEIVADGDLTKTVVRIEVSVWALAILPMGASNINDSLTSQNKPLFLSFLFC
jgi:hypothetical protein